VHAADGTDVKDERVREIARYLVPYPLALSNFKGTEHDVVATIHLRAVLAPCCETRRFLRRVMKSMKFQRPRMVVKPDLQFYLGAATDAGDVSDLAD